MIHTQHLAIYLIYSYYFILTINITLFKHNFVAIYFFLTFFNRCGIGNDFTNSGYESVEFT